MPTRRYGASHRTPHTGQRRISPQPGEVSSHLRRKTKTKTGRVPIEEPARSSSRPAACRRRSRRHEDASRSLALPSVAHRLPRPGSVGNLFAKSCSAPNASRSTHEASRSRRRLRRGRPRAIRCQAGSPTMALSCSTPIARSPKRSTKAARSRRRPNGWSITTISSRADPRDPLRSAARLLPTTAEAGRRAVRRISAGVRRGLGLRRPHR